MTGPWSLPAAGGAASSGTAVSGNLQATVAQSKTNSLVGEGAEITAYDSVGIVADQTAISTWLGLMLPFPAGTE